MLHKLRKAMADRNEGYKLSGLVEIDDFYIGPPTENGKYADVTLAAIPPLFARNSSNNNLAVCSGCEFTLLLINYSRCTNAHAIVDDFSNDKA